MPVLELAKLASAFKILIFAFTNVAVIAFREGEVEFYNPAFESPGYPWVQVVGILGGIVLLTQMGWLPILGAVGIVTGGILWYRFYGRERTEREGVALEALRRNLRAPLFLRMHDTFSLETGAVMVAVSDDAPPEEEATTLSMGADVARLWEGRVLAARFETVPEQMSLPDAETHVTEADRSFEERVRDLEVTTTVPTETHEIVCHDAGRAALHFARTHDVRLLLGTITPGRWHHEMLGTDVDWFVRTVPCEVALFSPHRTDGRADALRDLVILLPRAPYGPMKAFLADALAQSRPPSGRIRFLTAMGSDVTDDEVDSVQAFHDRPAEHCDSPTTSQTIRTDDVIPGLVAATGDADLAFAGTMARSRLRDLFFPNRTNELLEALPCDVVLVRPQRPYENTQFRRLVERAVF